MTRTSLVMFITLMFDFHISRKKPLTIFLHAILCLNLTKPFHFKKQIVTGNRKWILYNNVEWKRLWGKWNEPPPTTTRPVFIQRRWCVYGGIGREFSYELLENQRINSNKYCSHLNQLEAALDKKHPKLVNRECIIFHQDNTNHVFLWWPGKNCYSLTGKFWFVCLIHQMLYLWCPLISVFTEFS